MVILVEHEYNKLGIDRLVYTYETGGNRLTRVTDSAPAATRAQGFIDGNTTGNDYSYDLNGNITVDRNKGIDKIEYNYLNLPRKILGGSQTIEYIYSANGQKLQKKAPNNEITRYSGNFIYEGTSLKQVLHGEGYIDMNGTPTYHYYLKDHLGNNRMVVNQSGTVVQQTDYYPFGMTFNKSGSSDNKYLYNGKELQEDAIGNGLLDWLDYGNRFCDPSIGRWHAQDLMAEFYYDQSPYNYVGNDPINYIDPNGDFRTKFSAWWHKLWNGGDGIGKDKGGEYFVYTQNATEDEEGGVTVTSTRVFDKNGRSEGKDLAYEKKKAEYVKMLEHESQIDKWVAQGIYDRSLTVSEVRQNRINDFALVALPNILKTTSAITTTTKSGISSVDDLLKAAGQLKRVKGAKQGFVSGNAQNIFNSLIKGGTKVRGNLYRLKDGTLVNFHKSTRTGAQTIDINKAGQVFKIRVQ
jgi:RHS repeat-associated protein